MVNNFKLLRTRLSFTEPGDFYFLQLLRRASDNPEFKGNQNYRSKGDYYITSLEKFDAIEDEIIELCNVFKARAYLRLNKRNFKDINCQMMKMLTEHICSNTFVSINKLVSSATGRSRTSGTKTWLVDIDKENLDRLEIYKSLISECEPFRTEFFEVPTKSGLHLIVEPFNIQKFSNSCISKGFQIPDIHKDNPTVLYIPNFT